MVLDPRISLGVQVPQVSQALQIFENTMMNQQTRELREAQEQRAQQLAPLEMQQLEQRLALGQSQLDEQEENRILRSVSEFGTKLRPVLESGDIVQAQKMLTNRLIDLEAQGLPTNETVEAITAVRGGNVQGVIDNIDAVQQIAGQRGLVGSQQKSLGQKEFENLISIAQNPSSTQLEKDSARRKLGDLAKVSGGVAKVIDVGGVPHQFDPVTQTATPLTIDDKVVTGESVAKSEAEIAGEVQAAKSRVTTEAAGKTAAVKVAVDFAKDANTKLTAIPETILTYKDAIEQLDKGANTGVVYNMLPSFDTAAMILDNISSQAGFNLAKSGGGIITEADMDWGMRTAIPQNLSPEDLKVFLKRKIEAQEKIFNNLQEVVGFLGDGSKTLTDWYKASNSKGKAKKLSDDELLKGF